MRSWEGLICSVHSRRSSIANPGRSGLALYHIYGLEEHPSPRDPFQPGAHCHGAKVGLPKAAHLSRWCATPKPSLPSSPPRHLESRRLTRWAQGCCFSLSRGPNSPHPGAAPARPQPAHLSQSQPQSQSQSQSQPQSQPQPQPSPSARPTGPDVDRAGPQQHRSRHRRRPLDQHINKPLRRNEWSSKSRIWSRGALDRERTDFFDTRVSGRPEIWQALHAALAVLWAADTTTRDDPNDSGDDKNASLALATAQSILDAADITLPTGNLADGVYDLLGNYYQLPAHIVSDPTNIASGDEDNGDNDDDDNDDDDDRFGEAKTAEDATASADDDQGQNLDDEAERRRVHKGKSVVNASDQVLAVVRLSNTARDLKLDVGRDEAVRSIIHRIVEESKVSGTQRSFSSVQTALVCLIADGICLSCSAPLWLSCSPRTHGQNPEGEYFPYGSGLDGPGHQCFCLQSSTLESGSKSECVDSSTTRIRAWPLTLMRLDHPTDQQSQTRIERLRIVQDWTSWVNTEAYRIVRVCSRHSFSCRRVPTGTA